jgi:outer membrane protein
MKRNIKNSLDGFYHGLNSLPKIRAKKLGTVSVVAFVTCFALLLSQPLFAVETYADLSLKQAIQIALTNNGEKKISYQAAAIAESQYQEALSARWPTLTLQGSFQRRDEAPTFVFPSSSMPLGDLRGALQGAASVAAGGGAAGAAAAAQVPSSIAVPEQNVKLFNRDSTITSLQVMYPLYTGGKISSLIAQAGLGKEIAHEEMRRSTLQVIRDVKRYYYAAQLTQSLTDTAHDTLNLLASTRDLTKTLYESGSATVNKLDFLKTEMAVSYTKSIEADFSSRHKSALAALANAMGVAWDSKITLSEKLKVKTENSAEVDALVQQANEFNPQVGMLKLAVKAAQAKIDEAQSGHLPQIAITADTTHISNSYNAGLTNDVNRNSWTIGVGVSLPLFDGWRTTSQVSTAKLQHEQMQEKQKLVEQGIATLVKNLFIEFDGARQQVAISEQAKMTSEENRDLTSRAFQIGASKPQDVVEANVMHAIIQGNLLRAQHDQLLKLSEIDYVLGSEAE